MRYFFSFYSVSKSTDKLKSLTGGKLIPDETVTKLRDAIKDSCESIIKTFEDLTKRTPQTKKTAGGGVLSVQISVSLILAAVLLSLKMF